LQSTDASIRDVGHKDRASGIYPSISPQAKLMKLLRQGVSVEDRRRDHVYLS